MMDGSALLKNTLVLNKIIEQLTLTLKTDSDNPKILKQLVQHYRMLGDLDSALEFIRRAVEHNHEVDLYDRMLLNILSQSASDEVVEEIGLSPAKFMVKKGFLSSDLADELFLTVTRHRLKFFPSKLRKAHSKTEAFVDTEIRRQLSFVPDQPFIRNFRKLLDPVLPEVGKVFGIKINTIESVHLQMTASGNGHFSKPHQDIQYDESTGRYKQSIAFVYYLHNDPKKYEGGDLLIYDTSKKDNSFSDQYTRLRNENNSLVAFPGYFFHEITQVKSESTRFEDGRFGITFWYFYS